MSDSDGADGDDDSGSKERRRAKKTSVSKGAPVVTVDEIPDVDPPDPFERFEVEEKPTAKESKKNSEKQKDRIRAG